MNASPPRSLAPPDPAADRLRAALDQLAPHAAPADKLAALIAARLDQLPLPGAGAGATLDRFRALCAVARHDLVLGRLFEAHADALAILAELAPDCAPPDGAVGVWAAEPPDARVLMTPHTADGRVRLDGRKAWCSGAGVLTQALVTVWGAAGDGPHLAWVDLRAPGVAIDESVWRAVGMRGSASYDVRFDAVPARIVGRDGIYLTRPGFWHGGAGVAACWLGGALALGDALRAAVARRPDDALALCALGRVDAALAAAIALLRATADAIDGRGDDAAIAPITLALRLRGFIERSASFVLDEAAQILGPVPFCREARFARLAADLPIYLRQWHGPRDFAALGRLAADRSCAWAP